MSNTKWAMLIALAIFVLIAGRFIVTYTTTGHIPDNPSMTITTADSTSSSCLATPSHWWDFILILFAIPIALILGVLREKQLLNRRVLSVITITMICMVVSQFGPGHTPSSHSELARLVMACIVILLWILGLLSTYCIIRATGFRLDPKDEDNLASLILSIFWLSITLLIVCGPTIFISQRLGIYASPLLSHPEFLHSLLGDLFANLVNVLLINGALVQMLVLLVVGALTAWWFVDDSTRGKISAAMNYGSGMISIYGLIIGLVKGAIFGAIPLLVVLAILFVYYSINPDTSATATAEDTESKPE